MGAYHIPVLLQPVCALLNIRPGGKYIDATLGGGGHTREILRLGGQVLAIDQDPEALMAVPDLPGLTKVPDNFSHLSEIALSRGWHQVDGILFDLGVSLHQLQTGERGFSIQVSGPLDMRMDPSLLHTAATIINNFDLAHLAQLLNMYGEIPNAKSIAHKIIENRPISTTDQLVAILKNRDLSRTVFQAIRIAVNDELGSLQSALPQALNLLTSCGRLAVISFHSLEDKIVKNHFKDWHKIGLGQIVTAKPVTPDAEELIANSASHSAKLRVFQKI